MAAQDDKQAWSEFDSTGVTPSEVFERVVALRLYAREIGKRPHELALPPNFPGVESPPVEVGGEWVSFQAKYAGDLKTPWPKIKSSIRKALAKKSVGYYQLDRIFIYTSGTPGGGTKEERHADHVKIDHLASAGGIELTWLFGSQVLDAIREVPDLWVLFDPTYPRLRSPDQVRDHSRVPAARFVGREVQFDRLTNFLEDERAFLWWGLGGRSGSGKTRLLKEFARRIPSDWSMAWLGGGSEPLAHRHVSGPLMLVVDGPLTHGISHLSKLLESFSAAAPPHKLRLLFVDRDPDVWESELTAGNTNGSDQLRYGKALTLGELQEDDWAVLVSEVAAAQGVDDAALLQEFPPGKGSTPLDLLLSAGADSDGSTKAVRGLLADDRKQHYPQASDPVLDAAAALTIVKDCDKHALTNSTPLSALLTSSTESRQLLAVVGATAATGTSREISGISPDLVGELFVLDRWQQTPLVALPASLDQALDLGVAGSVVDFFHRSSTDYPGHDALGLLNADPPADSTRARTWILSQAAVVPNVYALQPELAEHLLRRLSRHEPAIGFQALLHLLQARSGKGDVLPSLAHFDNPALLIKVHIPVAAMRDLEGEVVEDKVSKRLSEEVATLEFNPPPFGSLTRLLLVSEFCHSANANDIDRYERAVGLLRNYVADVDFDNAEYTDVIRNAIIAAQHRADRGAEWAATVTDLYDELTSRDPSQASGDVAVVVVRALGASNRGIELVEELRLASEQTNSRTTYLGALVNHTGRLRAESQRAADCAAEILRLCAIDDLSNEDADLLHQAADNLYQKVSSGTEDTLHRTLTDQLVNRAGFGWSDGAQQTIRKLGSQAHAALLDRDLEKARVIVETLTSPQLSSRFDISWPLNTAFSALADELLSDHDFADAWKILEPHRHQLPPNQLSTQIGEWYSMVMRTKTFGGERHNTIRGLDSELPSAQGIAEALDSVQLREQH